HVVFVFLSSPRPPCPTPFPYTTLFRSVFDSPRDRLIWDVGHQSYVHKLVTGRKDRFGELRRFGGLSGYPSRQESPHDWVENRSGDRKSTRLNSSHVKISYAVFCLKKKN